MKRSILVGVDGSEPALKAVDWAAEEASRRGCGLFLVAALAVPPVPALSALSEEEARADAETAFAGARERVRRARPDVGVEEAAVLDSPTKALLDRAGRAEMVVVGLRGRGGLPGMKVGSVAYRVAAHSPVPVVVVGPEPRTEGEPVVVVGADGSPHGRQALNAAFDEASLRGGTVRALRTWRPVTLPSPAAVEASEQEGLERDLAAVSAEHPGVPVEAQVLEEVPVVALAEAARGADLLVVGARGHHGFPRAALGATAHGLLHRAPCPLMIVHSA